MGIINWLGIGKDIAEPINAVGNLYTTDKERLEADAKLEEIEQKPVLAQLNNNAISAASFHFFNSGWQPMIGWASGFLVLLYYAPQIVITTYLWAHLSFEMQMVLPFPMKPDEILNLVYLLFGFGMHSILRQGILKR